MKRSWFTEQQIVGVLKEAEAGVAVKELCRKLGISDATFYNGKAKYGGLSVSDLKRLKELEAENAKLKRMYADLAGEDDVPGTCAVTRRVLRMALEVAQQAEP